MLIITLQLQILFLYPLNKLLRQHARSLGPEEVRAICDPSVFNTTGTAAEPGKTVIIGQDRAIKALMLGLGIKAHGFNIFVSGAPGTGKLTAVTDFVSRQARNEPTPSDWCYVNNFKDAYRPEQLCLPPGNAMRFKKEVKKLVQDIYHALIKVFESEDYANRKQALLNTLDEGQARIMGTINEHAAKESFMVKQTQTSIITIPLKNNKPLNDARIKELTEEELDTINKKQNALQDEIAAALREIEKLEKSTGEQVDKLTHDVALFAIGSFVDDLADDYKLTEQVVKYLQQLRTDIMDNLPEFMKSQKGNGNSSARSSFPEKV